MKIFNTILEIITSPFSFLLRAAGVSNQTIKWCKPLIVFAVSVVIVTALVLFVYRESIFK